MGFGINLAVCYRAVERFAWRVAAFLGAGPRRVFFERYRLQSPTGLVPAVYFRSERIFASVSVFGSWVGPIRFRLLSTG
jgi:hypothetical protein